MRGLTRVSYRIVAVLVLLGVASAVPAPQSPQPPSNSTPSADPSACAKIAQVTASQLAATPLATLRVPASLAKACLDTVPNKVGPAQDMIRSLKSYVNWQSTLAFLKTPPASYMLPPTDIQGGLDAISAGAQAGSYKSEFDFQVAIVELFATAHDGHFAYRPDAFKAFGFRNTLLSTIVSVSRDGTELPNLYHLDALRNMTSNSTMPPAIVKINGQEAAMILEATNLKFSGFQDPDSQWNAQLPNYARPQAQPFLAASIAFQGEKVTVTYDNGQETSQDSFAIVRAGANFTGVNTGEDFYNKFCTPAGEMAAMENIMMQPTPSQPGPGTNTSTNPTSPPSPTVRAQPPPAPTIRGYPFPVIRDSGANVTAGYFLNGTGYDNVAVLAVSGFAPEGDFDGLEYLTNFQKTVETFLAKSKEAGKERLVIDVTANGGGFVVAGYDMFAQLFPDLEPFQATNLRLTDSLINMARISNSIISQLDTFNTTDPNQRAALGAIFSSEVVGSLVPGGVFSPVGANFSTVEQILAPVSLRGDQFTAYQQTPLNSTASDFNLTGTGNRANPPPAVFRPENVVILTDGTCGSTCTLMSYLLINQAGVRTTVVGGRPQQGPMQSIAGVEGAQVFPMESLATAARAALVLAPAERVQELRGTEIVTLAEAYALTRAATPGTAGAVNGKNAFSMTDAQVPLQFLYEPANCRFFHTRATVMSPADTWKMAVDATWTDPARFCVQGSRVENNATSGAGALDPLFRLSVDNKEASSGATGPARGSAARKQILLAVFVSVAIGAGLIAL